MGSKSLSDAAIMALIAWHEASKENSQDSDDDWAAGFMKVQRLQDNLCKYFSSEEITGFILHREKLDKIIESYKSK